METPGGRFRTLREQVNISQKELSRLAGVSQVTINRYENDQSEPPYRLLKWYGDYFDVSLDYLLCRTDQPQGKLYQCTPQEQNKKQQQEMKQFVEDCFDPKSPLSTRLKNALLEIWRDQSTLPSLAKAHGGPGGSDDTL